MPSKDKLPTDEDLRSADYAKALRLRSLADKPSHDLVALDRWFREDLRKTVGARAGKDGEGRYLTVEELGRVMDWKLARGKWRPRLHDFALSNASSLVKSTTVLASSPSFTHADAVASLTQLKGIGPAAASAILSLLHPSTEPMLSDEAHEAVGLGKATYTKGDLEAFRNAMDERKRGGRWESMEEMECKMYAWVVGRRYGKEALEEGGYEAKKAEEGRKQKRKKEEEDGGEEEQHKEKKQKQEGRRRSARTRKK